MSGGAPVEYALRLGDNALVLGQRLSEWCGHGPILEEDLALANVCLDLLGQARQWLSLAGAIEGRGRDEDRLAFRRDAGEFRNLLLVEQPNGDYAHTMARQFYFDAWHVLVLDGLKRSTDARVAEIANTAAVEATYHLERSSAWVVRLGDGAEESHARMQAAADALWPFTGEMFDMDEVDRTLVASGIAVDPGAVKPAWRERVGAVFAEATLAVPAEGWMQSGGKQGRHGEHLGFLLAEMQFLQRAYPDARW